MCLKGFYRLTATAPGDVNVRSESDSCLAITPADFSSIDSYHGLIQTKDCPDFVHLLITMEEYINAISKAEE